MKAFGWVLVGALGLLAGFSAMNRTSSVDRLPPGLAEGRLRIAYWPGGEPCLAGEVGTLRALRQYQADFPDSSVVTLVPRGTQWPAGDEFEPPRPLIQLAELDAGTNEPGGVPRLAVWSAEGQLLLFRVLSGLDGRGQRLYEELVELRALTGPAEREPS